MIDWTKLTDDPNNRAAKEEVRRYLLSVRRLHTDVGLLEFIENLVEGKVVNQIIVPEPIASEAKLALQRMLDRA